jgi:putative transposase
MAYWNGVKLDLSRPGKPTDNAFIESFNGKFRQECLNQRSDKPFNLFFSP